MTYKVLLLNDTDEGATHFGCMRVMRTIRSELAKRGFDTLPSIKVGSDWKRDPHLVAQIDAAELVVINGEGTLHHGKRRGRWLLEAGARVKARGGRVALINALWQDNPPDWATLARDFDLLWCRDQRSASALAQATGGEVHCLGDLSMFDAWTPTTQHREGIMVGCSVHGSVTQALARFAKEGGHDFIPVTTAIKTLPARLTGWRLLLRRYRQYWQNVWFQHRFPAATFLRDDMAFLSALSQHRLVVTGRFHAVCLAVLSGTPFLAVASNSWKIQALIQDIGLDPARLRSLDSLTQECLSAQDWTYTEAEREAIEASLSEWREKGTALFDRIAALIPNPPTSTAYSALPPG
jgi:hypothetical protein